MLRDPSEFARQIDTFLRYKEQLKNGFDPSEIELDDKHYKNMERYLHADDMIHEYSFSSQKARKIHRDKFELNRHETIVDFMVAFHCLGREKIYNRKNAKAFGIVKIEQALELAFEKQDLQNISALLHRYYLYNELDKEEKQIPNFEQLATKITIELHKEAVPGVNRKALKQKLGEMFLSKEKFLALPTEKIEIPTAEVLDEEMLKNSMEENDTEND